MAAIHRWTKKHYNQDGWYAAFLFDRTVSWFGNHIENKLMERDEQTHKPIYTLEGLLSDAPKMSMIEYLKELGAGVRKGKGKS